MKSYTNSIGIDIGKFNFEVAITGSNTTTTYENNPAGFKQFFKDFKKDFKNSLCVLEPTGGYELGLLLQLCEKKFSVHRAHTRKVKEFARSYGNGAKTDKLDAINLARYGLERYQSLELFKPASKNANKLYNLIQRRSDLTQMIVAEKNRLMSAREDRISKSIEKVIQLLSKEIIKITSEVNRLIESDSVLKAKKQVLKTIKGIGDIVANELLALLPELGSLSRRQIASLVGLAPIAKDSGKMKGYRRTGYGRSGVKPMLFLAAMAARNSKSNLRQYYEELISRGKCKMVALTALMRKIIVIANARLRDLSMNITT